MSFTTFARILAHLPSHGLRSLSTHPQRKTLQYLQSQYKAKVPITMLTAYDYPTALHAERAGVDVVLVGDSLGMVVLGHRTTQSVTIDHMIHHSTAARRAVNQALLIADLPFGSYEVSPQVAIQSAVRLVKASAVDAIKLEGGINRAPAIRRIVDAGIAVMGHVGLLPQAISREGAFRATGRTAQTAINIIRDARAVEEAGAFAIVLECVPERVAALVSEAVNIPVIGIGSGVKCAGQVLVYHDMLGVLSHPHHATAAPKFSKAFVDVGYYIDKAIREYCIHVRGRAFPSATHAPYSIPDEEYDQLKRLLASEQSTPRSLSSGPSAPKTVEDEPTRLY